jgi:hypothetical protein
MKCLKTQYYAAEDESDRNLSLLSEDGFSWQFRVSQTKDIASLSFFHDDIAIKLIFEGRFQRSDKIALYFLHDSFLHQNLVHEVLFEELVLFHLFDCQPFMVFSIGSNQLS